MTFQNLVLALIICIISKQNALNLSIQRSQSNNLMLAFIILVNVKSDLVFHEKTWKA